MGGMDAKTARGQKIKALVAQAGGPSGFAARYGAAEDDPRIWTRPQVAIWVSETKPKIPGHSICREIERRVGLPAGFLDQAGDAGAIALPAPVVRAVEAQRSPYGPPAAMEKLIDRLEGDVDQLRGALATLLTVLTHRERAVGVAVKEEMERKPPAYRERGGHAILLNALNKALEASAKAPRAVRPRAKAGSR
jgi:hypothetical protein